MDLCFCICPFSFVYLYFEAAWDNLIKPRTMRRLPINTNFGREKLPFSGFAPFLFLSTLHLQIIVAAIRGKKTAQEKKKTLREGEKWSDIHWNPLKYADNVSLKDKREKSKKSESEKSKQN